MKLIVAGGRDFDFCDMVRQCIELEYLPFYENLTIITGGARGADRCGKLAAEALYLPNWEYMAEWDLYGKSAGYRRNVLMAEQADALLAFWDGESKGTKHMIDIATERGLEVNVKRY